MVAPIIVEQTPDGLAVSELLANEKFQPETLVVSESPKLTLSS